MTEKASIIHSQFVIDGIPQELTPAQILDAVSIPARCGNEQDSEPVVDETVDPVTGSYVFEPEKVEEYLSLVVGADRTLSLPFADSYTRLRVATAFIDALWREGHFRIGDICLDARWRWSAGELGSMAAFYASVQAAGDYLDSLSLGLHSYSFTETDGERSVAFTPVLAADADDDEVIQQPFRVDRPQLTSLDAVPRTFVREDRSWIVYVPFETCDYRLGGSLLARKLGLGGGAAVQIEDADYFIDCYEVVRELVEDGVALAGVRSVTEASLRPSGG